MKLISKLFCLFILSLVCFFNTAAFWEEPSQVPTCRDFCLQHIVANLVTLQTNKTGHVKTRSVVLDVARVGETVSEFHSV